METPQLEDYYWQERRVVREKVKKSEIEQKKNSDPYKKIKHLRKLLSDVEIKTSECDICHFVSKESLFRKIQCMDCKEEIYLCPNGKCTEIAFIEPLKEYCCLICLEFLSRKRKRDLLDFEVYDLKVKKLKSMAEYDDDNNYIILPFKDDESIACSELVGVSYSLRNEEIDEAVKSAYFECDICEMTLPKSEYIGDCSRCSKKLGSCCYYENQWSDRSSSTITIPEVTKFICPCCIDSLSFSFTSEEEEEEL